MQTIQQSWWTPTSSLPLCPSTFPWGPAGDDMLEWLPQTPHSQWQTVTDQWTHTMICSNASKSAHSAANYHAMKCSTYQLATKVNQCQGNPKMHVKVFDLHLWRLVNQSSWLVNYTGWWNGRTQITLSQLKGNQTDSWLCLMEKEFA